MAEVTFCSDLGTPQNKVCHCFHCFPINLPWSVVQDAMISVVWMLSFKPTFSLSSFTFIKKLFGSSLLSAIRVMSSAYPRLLIFLPGILISASSRPGFHMMCSAYKLNKQGDNLQPWRTPFLISWRLRGKEVACQSRRHRFNPWVRKIPWRRKWLPTPVFLPGKSHGQRSLVGYSLWTCKELDMTERLTRL